MSLTDRRPYHVRQSHCLRNTFYVLDLNGKLLAVYNDFITALHLVRRLTDGEIALPVPSVDAR